MKKIKILGYGIETVDNPNFSLNQQDYFRVHLGSDEGNFKLSLVKIDTDEEVSEEEIAEILNIHVGDVLLMDISHIFVDYLDAKYKQGVSGNRDEFKAYRIVDRKIGNKIREELIGKKLTIPYSELVLGN